MDIKSQFILAREMAKESQVSGRYFARSEAERFLDVVMPIILDEAKSGKGDASVKQLISRSNFKISVDTNDFMDALFDILPKYGARLDPGRDINGNAMPLTLTACASIQWL